MSDLYRFERFIAGDGMPGFRYVEASRSDVLEWLGVDAVHLVERANGELHCENCLHVKAVEDPDFDMIAAMEGVGDE